MHWTVLRDSADTSHGMTLSVRLMISALRCLKTISHPDGLDTGLRLFGS